MDSQSLTHLYQQHHGWLRGWLQRRLGHAGDAADFAHDTYLRVIESRTALADIREPRAFLTTVAQRVMVSHFRRREVERAYLEALAQMPEDLAPSPEERAIVLETLLEIDRILDGLPPKVRQAFLWAQLDGMPYAEIAQRLAAHKDADSFRDHQSSRNSTLYGTLEADLTPDTVLGAGLTYKKRALSGATGTTPIQAYSGTGEAVEEMPRSFNVGAPWAGYDQESLGLFARLEHSFAGGWKAKLQVARDTVDTPAFRIGYLRYALPGQLQFNRYNDIKDRNDSISLDVQGPFELFGRTHDLLVGAGSTKARTTLLRGSGGASTLTAAGIDYAGGGAGIAEPNWNSLSYSNDLFSRKNRYVYTAGRFSLADPVKLIAGARVTDYEQKDVTDIGWYNYSMRERGVVTPYAGLIVDVTKDISVYGSYASIFQPQSSKDASGSTLLTSNDESIYEAVHGAIRRGYELELSGELARGWQAQGSYVLNSTNMDTSSTLPRHQVKLGSTYRFANGLLQDLTVGGAMRWQSPISTSHSGATLRQDAYWVFDLMGRYQVDRHWSVNLNIDNVFDKKFYSGVTNFSGQGLFYTWGMPRSVNLSARYEF